MKSPKKIAESKRGLAFLIESELEKTEIVIATQAISEKLSKMAQDLAKVTTDDMMPLLDKMTELFGQDAANRFKDTVTENINQTTDALMNAKTNISAEVSRLKGEIDGTEVNDMATGIEGGAADNMDMGDGLGDDDLGDVEIGDDNLAPTGADDDAANLGLDAENDLDSPENSTAAGRARKESVQHNIKALRESKNPERLIFETFRRTLKEARSATVAARAVAEAFAIDLEDVIDIVREGKTWKDEKGNSQKNKDRAQDRKDKKRDRPNELDESKSLKENKDHFEKEATRYERLAKEARNQTTSAKSPEYYESKAKEFRDKAKECDSKVEEGKTFKDERGRSDKNKDRAQDRKDKKRDRPSDLDEAKTFGSGPKKDGPVFGKRKPDPLKDVPNDFGDMKSKKSVAEEKIAEFKMDQHPSRKGMFKGKTKEELHKELTSVKARMKSYEDKGEKVPDALRTKFSELTFALRAKNDWGSVEEGKTWKDQKDRSGKSKDWSQDRKDKKRDRPSEMDECDTESKTK